jgi:FMN phosphatase YigB (HAD superfamily)
MSPIKGIFFDAAGVFYDRREPTTVFAKRRLKELGYAGVLPEHQVSRSKEMHVLATEGRIHHAEYWDQLLQMYGVEPSPVRAGLVQEVLAQTFDVYAYPGGPETMAVLQDRGFLLGIVTDTIYPVEWKMKWLERVGVAEFIKVISCSTVLGAHKPQPAMYLNAVTQAHLDPSEAVFVGHDADELEGAHQAGIATVAVHYEPGTQADYYAPELLDLLDVPILKQ